MASPSPVISAETLKDLQSKLSTARKKVTKLRTAHDKAEEELSTIRKAVKLDYVLEREGKKFKGSNKEARDAELDEILDQHESYRDVRSKVAQLLREKREAEDDVSDLETQLKIDLQVFEDNRHKLNRAMLAEVLGHEAEPPVRVTVETAAAQPLRDSAKRSLYSDLGD